MPIKENVSTDSDSLTAQKAILIFVTVFDGYEMLALIWSTSTTTSIIIEEYIVLHNNVCNAVDINLLLSIPLVIENVIFNGYEPASVIYLEQIVIVRVVNYIIAEGNIFRPKFVRALYLDNNNIRTWIRMAKFETFENKVPASIYF